MINLNDYMERIIGVYMQYRFTVEALDRFNQDNMELEKYVEQEAKALSPFLKNFASVPGILKTRYLKSTYEEVSDYWTKALPSHLDKAYNTLRQNVLILFFALFESLMKNIHREVLFKNPKFLKADRQIQLGRLISSGDTKIIEEEVDREVQSLDRRSVEDRAKHFSEPLGMPWSDATDQIQRLSELNDLRNRIMHQNPDQSVSEEQVDTALLIFISIPSECYSHGSKKYPGVFQNIF